MSKPGSRADVRRPFSPAWLIVFAGVLTAVLVFWLRWQTGRPTALEALIATNEPMDHLHALTVTPGGTTYVGTHLGLLARQGDAEWTQAPDVMADVTAIAPAGGESLYLAGPGLGIARYAGGQLQPLSPLDQAALAVEALHPAHVLAYARTSGLTESRDGGQTWQPLSDLGGADIYALTVHPQDGKTVVAGGVNGFLAVSKDGGRTWTFPPALSGSISALSFDPQQPQRLWAAAGGSVRTSEDLGANWRSVATAKAKDRTVVALAFPRRAAPVRPLPPQRDSCLPSLIDADG